MSKNIKETPVTNTTVIGVSFIKQLINRKILLIFKNFVKSLEGDVTSSFIIYLTRIYATYNDADASNFYNKRLEIDIL